MKRILRAGLTEIELRTGPDDVSQVRHTLGGAEVARRSLWSFAEDPIDLVSMRALLAEEAGPGGLARVRDEEVVRRLEQRLVDGRLHAVQRRVELVPVVLSRQMTDPVVESLKDAGVAAVTPEEESPMAWVAIELVDEEGLPVSGEEYWVRTASNKTITGRLDREGRARIEGVEPGTCSVTFPNLDNNDWQQA